MREKSFAESVLRKGGHEPPEVDGPRKGFVIDPQQTAQAFSLSVRFKDGRKAQGFSWAMFNGYEWDCGGEAEILTLVFSAANESHAVVVSGQHLATGLHAMNSARLKTIQQHDTAEVRLLRADNANTQEKQPVIEQLQVYPAFARIVDQIIRPPEGGPDAIGST